MKYFQHISNETSFLQIKWATMKMLNFMKVWEEEDEWVIKIKFTNLYISIFDLHRKRYNFPNIAFKQTIG